MIDACSVEGGVPLSGGPLYTKYPHFLLPGHQATSTWRSNTATLPCPFLIDNDNGHRGAADYGTSSVPASNAYCSRLPRPTAGSLLWSRSAFRLPSSFLRSIPRTTTTVKANNSQPHLKILKSSCNRVT